MNLRSPLSSSSYVRGHPWKKPVHGDKFDYYVHEYGAFDGVVTPPKELGIDEIKVANDGFYYRRHLTVHASNAAPRERGR